MSSKLVNCIVVTLAIIAGPTLAGTARSALPACGFAAIESSGPDGFHYCDNRNTHGDSF